MANDELPSYSNQCHTLAPNKFGQISSVFFWTDQRLCSAYILNQDTQAIPLAGLKNRFWANVTSCLIFLIFNKQYFI